MSLQLLVVVSGVFFLAGLVKGASGMGLPTVAMGLLGAWLTPLTAAGLLIVPSLLTNVWQMMAGPSLLLLLRRFWLMLAVMSLVTLVSLSLMVSLETSLVSAALGTALLAYSLHGLLGRHLSLPLRWEGRLSPIVGGLTGLITGVTGLFVVPTVAYLDALRLEKDELVQALGLSFTASTVALGAGLAWQGSLQATDMLMSTIAAGPAIAGMAVGQRIRGQISALWFRRCFLIGMGGLAVELLTRLWR